MDELAPTQQDGGDETAGHQGEPVERMLPFLERIIDAMAEAVIVLDQLGLVIAVNRAAVSLLGLPDKAAALRPLEEYDQLTRDWRVGGEPFAPAALRRSLAGETMPRQLATITTAAGIERVIQFTSTPIRDEQGQVVLAMLAASDVTHEQRVAGYWKAVAMAAQGLATELEVEPVLESVLDQVIEALGGEVVIGYWRLDEARQRLILASYRGFSEKTVVNFRSLRLDGPSLIGQAGQTKQIYHVEDTQQTPPRHEMDRRLVEDEMVLSLVVTPLVVTERLRGVMAYGWRTPHRLYEEDLQATRTISDLFAVALDHARLYGESQRRSQELERAQEMREEFIAAVAHDLRGPIAVIKGNGQLLQRFSRLPGDKQEKVLDTVLDQTERLERMVADLLDVSRMVAGHFTVLRKPFELVQLARRVVEGFRSRESTHRLRVEAPEEVVGSWDEGRIEQVVENLVGNGVKFSPSGSQVVVRVIPRPYDVLVTVTDEGMGMTREEADRLFEPFTRVGAVQRIGGVGLGLYISRSIVETHGGRIWAESPGPGKGSTFYFTLPID